MPHAGPMYLTMLRWFRFLSRSISPMMPDKLSGGMPASDICLIATSAPVCMSVPLNTCRRTQHHAHQQLCIVTSPPQSKGQGQPGISFAACAKAGPSDPGLGMLWVVQMIILVMAVAL